MTETHHLCDLWEHTIAEVFKHDPKSILGLMLKEWVIFNKLENFNSILNYTIDDFTPSGNLSYLNQHGRILHQTPLKEVFSQDDTYNILWIKVKMKMKIPTVIKIG